jgi:hypothetical protein
LPRVDADSPQQQPALGGQKSTNAPVAQLEQDVLETKASNPEVGTPVAELAYSESLAPRFH